jgi:hypothetical protein
VPRPAGAAQEIDAFIERIANPGADREKANQLEEFWRESERKHREKIRRHNGAQWYGYHLTLADNHRALADEHEAKALALLEDERQEGARNGQA